MNTYYILLLALIIFIVDLPWLSLVGGNYSSIIQAIQNGKEVRMRPAAVLVVYPALAFLALRTQSLKDAFLTGVSVYAVYDFTVLAAFKDYPLYMAFADTLWGGLLFTIVFWIKNYFNIKPISA
jgi:uncharacterized membrane protein